MYDLVVIGSGPAGYIGAIRASQLGKKVACIEEDSIGGVCLNWGCIPTKAILKSAEVFDLIKNKSKSFGIEVGEVKGNYSNVIDISRDVANRLSKGIDFLFKKNKIDIIAGKAKIIGNNKIEITKQKEKQVIKSKKILIATGATSISLPNLKIDNKDILSSKSALVLKKLPKSILIIGGGAIGVEFAYIYNTFGVQVTLVEMQDHILPNEDNEVSTILKKDLSKKGINILTETKVISVDKKVDILKTKLESIKDKKNIEIQTEKILVAIGVKPNIPEIEISELRDGESQDNCNIKTSEGIGFIQTNENYETNIKNVYAVGDVIGPPLLAHVASWEGIEAVNGMFTEYKPKKVNYFPGCTYCKPQIASLGKTEEQLKKDKIEYKVGKFPFMANGKAIASGATDGFVKLLFGKKYNELLGAHIIGENATELISELSLGLHLEVTAEEIEHTIHAHPTLSEMTMEAAADALKKALHI